MRLRRKPTATAPRPQVTLAPHVPDPRVDAAEAERLHNILSYWRTLESLSHFTLPKRTSGAAPGPPLEYVSEIRAGGVLPWPVTHPPDRIPWHIVYIGIHRYAGIVAEMLTALGAEPEPESRGRDDLCCLASFVCDRNGFVVPDSALLAGHAWAAGRLQESEPLVGFDVANGAWAREFETRHADAEEALTLPDIESEVARAQSECALKLPESEHLPVAIVKRVWRYLPRYRKVHQAEPAENDLLSSFYLDDLQRIERVVSQRTPLPAGLCTYLSGEPASQRRDVRTDRDAIADELHLDNLPRGRWPQPHQAHLGLMQQFAVNRALGAHTQKSGLFSVNGPPGTGKTTLIRDIVAAVIVERATQMEKFAKPATAFREAKSRSGSRSGMYHLDVRLRGYELVVASSNNGAVENITRELPRREAVDDALIGDGDPLAAYATALLRGKRTGVADASHLTDAWALIAGVLGNRENRDVFTAALWPPKGGLPEDLATNVVTAEEWQTARQAFRTSLHEEQWHREQTAKGAAAGVTQIDEHFWNLDDRTQQISLPGVSSAHNRARGRLLGEAIRLHRAFLAAAGRPAFDNLDAVMRILRTGHSKADSLLLESLWSTLFLLVPVISTTFASFSRMFRDLEAESLGWLLIDEAGQASPQEAVGAIWRARTTVVIGDPLQIPPVITNASALLRTVHEQSSVADIWNAEDASVQSCADISNAVGTNINGLWVGSPLRVHRRCEEPMFTLSNRIAYDSAMVQGTVAADSRIGSILGKTRWFDVAGRAGDPRTHWIPHQGIRLRRLLEKALTQIDVNDLDIFVISPFLTVAAGARQSIAAIENGRLAGWAQRRVGTIHTVQGREADAVILLLGGNPDHPGALNWASSQPNILNVAITRARQRLYVVGDAGAWSRYPYFRDLHRELEVLPWHVKDHGA